MCWFVEHAVDGDDDGDAIIVRLVLYLLSLSELSASSY